LALYNWLDWQKLFRVRIHQNPNAVLIFGLLWQKLWPIIDPRGGFSMRRFLIFLILIGMTGFMAAQDNAVLDMYTKSFAKGSLSTKLEVIREAGLSSDRAVLGDLFLTALDFIRSNKGLLETEVAAKEMVILAAGYTGEIGYKTAASSLWDVFDNTVDVAVKKTCATALGKTAAGNQAVINKMDLWLVNTNALYLKGTKPNEEVLIEMIVALGNLGSTTSFSPLFTAFNTGYSDKVNAAAKDAVLKYSASLDSGLSSVLENNPLSEKKAALILSRDSSLSDEKKALVAQDALELALTYQTASATEKLLVRELRYEAVRILAQQKWVQGVGLVIRHFNKCIEEYDRLEGTKASLLEAIAALGALQSPEAVDRLILYIDLINTYTESGKIFDEQIAMAVIASLKSQANKKAVNSLQYIIFLKYPESIKKAAREAIAALKF
jgi:hypothetical protein